MLPTGGHLPARGRVFAGLPLAEHEDARRADPVRDDDVRSRDDSDSFAKKMIEWVKTGRRSPAVCARYMSRFCVCGVFNPERAERLLRRIAHEGETSAEQA